MKYVTTRKAVKAHYSTILCVPYADLQNLLRLENAESYTSGVYGWNADIFNVDGVAICTGYRPFGNVTPSHAAVKKFDRLAQEELSRYDGTNWEALRCTLHDLARRFVSAALEEVIG